MGWGFAYRVPQHYIKTRGTGLMVARFCLGIGQDVYKMPVLVDGDSFLFSQVPGQSGDRSTGLPGGQHSVWVLCGLKVMALP